MVQEIAVRIPMDHKQEPSRGPNVTVTNTHHPEIILASRYNHAMLHDNMEQRLHSPYRHHSSPCKYRPELMASYNSSP